MDLDHYHYRMQKVNVKDEWILSHAVSLSMLRDLVGLCTMSG